jgi:hypothetical protein
MNCEYRIQQSTVQLFHQKAKTVYPSTRSRSGFPHLRRRFAGVILIKLLFKIRYRFDSEPQKCSGNAVSPRMQQQDFLALTPDLRATMPERREIKQ